MVRFETMKDPFVYQSRTYIRRSSCVKGREERKN